MRNNYTSKIKDALEKAVDAKYKENTVVFIPGARCIGVKVPKKRGSRRQYLKKIITG
jgi:hypothetical protein